MRPAQRRRLRSNGAHRAAEGLRSATVGGGSRDDAVLGAIGGAVGAPRHRDDHCDAMFEAVELESEVGAKLMLQARPRRRDADAFLKRRQCGIRETEAVVADLDPEFVLRLARPNVDMAGAGLLRDAVLD